MLKRLGVAPAWLRGVLNDDSQRERASHIDFSLLSLISLLESMTVQTVIHDVYSFTTDNIDSRDDANVV